MPLESTVASLPASRTPAPSGPASTGPELDPELEPELDGPPDVVPELDPDLVPELEPEAVPELDPDLVPELEPEAVPELEPEAVPELEPEAVPELEPEAVPELELEVVPELELEVVPELPELEPAVVPELDPELGPLSEFPGAPPVWPPPHAEAADAAIRNAKKTGERVHMVPLAPFLSSVRSAHCVAMSRSDRAVPHRLSFGSPGLTKFRLDARISQGSNTGNGSASLSPINGSADGKVGHAAVGFESRRDR